MDIVFSTFNARYSHTALALRCLRASLGGLHDRSVIVEFDNRLSPQSAAEKLLAHDPKIILFSIYIWNLIVTYETVAILRTLRPGLKIVIGGPEVGFVYDDLLIFPQVDHLVCGEGESVIEKLCRDLLVSQASRLPCFNPIQEVRQSRRKNLPHWTQIDCTYFVTFRLADSIAQSRISEYKELRKKWEERHQPPFTESELAQFNELFSARVNDWLDEGAGACILSKPEISRVVADTLTHFDGKRYALDEWVIMPNHVHALVTPLPGLELKDILHSWKSYSAHAINKISGQKGAVWKHESYNHIIRDQEELLRIRKYIRNNPAEMRQGKRDACDTSVVPQASRLPCLEPSPPKVIHASPADLKHVTLPYDEYTDEDIAHRRIYVESSRGCPFKCEYCLSALEESVRFFPPERVFPEFKKLIERGVRIFKFLDRSFNINTAHAAAVLRFFLENRRDGMMLHLEWEPELLPPTLEKLITEAPPGFLQLEVGVQTFNPEVAARIDRRLDAEKVEAHIRKLAAMPSVHLHADLIAGLPGETFDSIAAGFDRLHACGPDEIQLGILKKLRGAPIAKHDAEWQMVYNTSPPYDVLQTATLNFVELQQIRRFARFWDIIVNNGRFPETSKLIWQNQPSVFAAFMEWSEWIYQQTHTTFGFTPARLAQLLEQFLTEQRGLNVKTVRHAIDADLAARSPAAKGMERQTRKKN